MKTKANIIIIVSMTLFIILIGFAIIVHKSPSNFGNAGNPEFEITNKTEVQQDDGWISIDHPVNPDPYY